MKGPNERQQNLCIYGGIFGAMLTATSLIQLMSYSRDHWLAYTLMLVYFKNLIVFVMLALQKHFSPLLMIVSSSLVMIGVAFVLAGGFYSLVLVLHFAYCVVITIVLYVEGLPARLKEKALIRRNEELAWRDKI